MRVQSMHFQARVGEKLADARLQQNLKKLADKFVTARANVMQEIDYTATRQAAVERRNRVLERLDVWLEMFERNATARGATVLFAETPAQASDLVVAIAKRHNVKMVTKSKSMVSEEMALNAALAKEGIESVETDLGEYILQINDNEAPSHIIAPVIHKDK
jgi:L-lactate dehydrogenase complex protein LldF